MRLGAKHRHALALPAIAGLTALLLAAFTGLASAQTPGTTASQAKTHDAMRATSAPSRPVAAHGHVPARYRLPAKQGAVNLDPQTELQNQSDDDCLNGTLALVYLTPCNTADLHMTWNATDYDVNGYLAYTLENEANRYCLNGALVTSHAQVTLTPCNSNDLHMQWYPLAISSRIDLFENASNGYCLNGALVTSHAQVTLTRCNSSDLHMLWYNTLPFPP